MSDYLISLIRTAVPAGVGAFLAWLASLGLDLNAESQTSLVVGLTAVMISLYYAIVRKLEKRYPAVGRWFLGAGAGKTPVYAAPTADVHVNGVLRR